MTMPFDPYYLPPMAPQRTILARPEYDLPGTPLAMPDGPVAMQGPMQGFSLAGPPMTSEPPPLVSQAPPPPPVPLMAPGDSLSQGAGGGGGGSAPQGGPPGALSAGTPGAPLVPMVQPRPAGAAGPVAPFYDSQTPGRAMTPGEVETDNLRRAMIRAELAKRASGGRWVPQQKFQQSESTQGLVGPDAELFGRYVDARGYRSGLDKENASMEAGLAQKQADAMATARGIEETARLTQERIEKQGQERAATVRDQIGVMNGKVQGEQYDNMRLWNSASDGKKAGFLMAAVLSGIGQSMMGQGGQQNSAIKALMDLSDRDAERQKVNIANNRQKLNDLQKLYKDTLEQTGSEKAAVSAVKIAKLEGLKGQVDTEAAMKRANQTTTRRMLDKDGNVVEWSVPLAAERTKATIDERIAQEDMILSREINGQISKQFAIKQAGYQGGSSGADMNKVLRLQEARGKSERDALESGTKMLPAPPKPGDTRVLYSGGQPFTVDPRVSSATIDDSQKRIYYADSGIEDAEAIGKKGLVLDGQARQMAADTLASKLAQAAGAGVPSESQLVLAKDATSPGPRQAPALEEARRQLVAARRVSIKNAGGRPELWPSRRLPRSRCTTPRAAPSRCLPNRWARRTARGRRRLPLTRTCPLWARTAALP